MDVLVIILFSSIFLVFLIFRTTRTRTQLPPGPPGLPLIGNLHQLPNSEPHRYLWHLSNLYGPLMFLRFGVKPAIVVSSARIAEQVMKTHDLVFASRPSLLDQRELSYNGLDVVIAPYSHYWREMRKLIAFGKRYESEDQGHERSRFHGLLNEAQALAAEFYFSDYVPWLGWVDRLRGLLSRLDKTFKQLDMFFQQVIDDHMNPTKPPTDQKDIINMLLQIMDARSSPFDLTLDHIKALLMNIFIAGTDTSAATIVGALTSLMKNPRVMKKVQDEITKLYGEKEFISEEDIERLPYLKAVVKETLRLLPPAPLLLPKESMDRCNIQGYEIQRKTLVLVNAWAIARDPEA